MAQIGISIAEKLIEVIGCAVVKEICDMWGYKSELDSLHETVKAIKKVLGDADSKRELNHAEQGYVEELKDAVYDAEDLFDEFLTLAELNQLGSINNDDKFFKKVRHFFSSKKKGMTQAYRISHKVKEIKDQLDSVASNYQQFKVSFSTKPIRERKETTSYLTNRRAIVGREDDKEVVLHKLLAPNLNIDDDVRFLTIVGTGGVGKTTLAKLVYDDSKVLQEFPDSNLRLWVCVSDQDGESFNVKAILCKIIALVSSVDKQKIDGTSTREEVEKLFIKNLEGKKYLLVLDDVWNEQRDEWLDLEKILKIGQSGSRILITTRSERTATIIGNKLFHKLEGLSPENSWNLFKILAFDQRELETLDQHVELVEIGRRIVAKCHNVPLAIEVVGSLLYGSHITKWRSFDQENGSLSEIANGDNKIMSILKLSYHNLEPSLKSCFTYCAIFPKDTVIHKENLISLWIAQGYVVPFDRGQTIEDAAEEHFSTLLQRCFFHSYSEDDCGETIWVKIHDLMHDVAQEVGLRELCIVSSTTTKMGDNVRHVRCGGERCPESFVFKSKIRSYVCGLHQKSVIESHRIDSWMCVRVLDFEGSSLEKLPDWIDKLLHLRYLNLSWNKYLETLPDSITKVHNLQTLLLRYCENLRELPKDISKLIKLRHLDLDGCGKLYTMPAGLDKLTNLRKLPLVVVHEGSISKERDGIFGLRNLKYLTAIKGELDIRISGNLEGMNNNDTEQGCLKRMKYLTRLRIVFDNTARSVDEERVIEKLEPHSNLKDLSLRFESGTIIPRWGTYQSNWANSLPLLVNIRISCHHLEQMPCLSKLRFLRTLYLDYFKKLEYMEEETSNHNIIISTSDDGEECPSTLFFPSLESLTIWGMKMLKGWRREEEGGHISKTSLRFSRLSSLYIWKCPSLTSFPLIMPAGTSHSGEVMGLKDLFIDNLEQLKLIFDYVTDQSSLAEDGQIPTKCHNQSLLSLHLMDLKDTHFPSALYGMQYLTSLHTLRFIYCDKLEALPEWIGDLSSLQNLFIGGCKSLRSLPKSMKKLTSLHTLEIKGSPSQLEPQLKDLAKILHIPNIIFTSCE